jgi:hypothetical protein
MRTILLWCLTATAASAGLVRRAEDPVGKGTKRFAEWNYANQSTADATPDGLKGVIIEPDLVEGKPGKDGATVTKIKFGPYKLGPGQTITRTLIGALNGKSSPCKDCYVTAMQHNLEYEDGKKANVDTGAWYVEFLLVIFLGWILTLSGCITLISTCLVSWTTHVPTR